jgi:hypothetical protein
MKDEEILHQPGTIGPNLLHGDGYKFDKYSYDSGTLIK